MQSNARNLPVLFSPVTMILERPALQMEFKTVWNKLLMVNHTTTARSLMPVMRLVDNNDLSLVKSFKEGFSEISLSVIDVWNGRGPFPSIYKIYRIVARSGKTLAGVAEMSLFAQEIERQPIFTSSDHFLAIAPRELLPYGDGSSFPSVSQDDHHGVMLGLTYDWVIEQCHVYVLVVDYEDSP